jgi:hypothetical protein
MKMGKNGLSMPTLTSFVKTVKGFVGDQYTCTFHFDEDGKSVSKSLSQVKDNVKHLKSVCQHSSFKIETKEMKTPALCDAMMKRLDSFHFNSTISLMRMDRYGTVLRFEFTITDSNSDSNAKTTKKLLLSGLNAAHLRAVFEYLNVNGINGSTVDNARKQLKKHLDAQNKTFFPFIATDHQKLVGRLVKV